MSSKNALDAANAIHGKRRDEAVAPPPWSLATRLTVWCSLSSFTLVLLGVGYLYWTFTSNLDRSNDRALADQLLPLVNLLRAEPLDLPAIRRQVELGRFAARQDPSIFIRVMDAEMQTLADTPGMGLVFRRDEFPESQPYDRERVTGTTVQSVDENWFRLMAVRTMPHGPNARSFIIQAAMDRTYEEQLLADYRRNLWMVLGAALLVCILGGYQIARRGIRPVRDIAQTASHIGSATLSERILATPLPAELRSLAETFNAMLGRLESSFVRLEQFAADLAHELRTPIHNLRGEAEVALSKARSAAGYQETLGSALEEYERLSRLIDNLLFLARAENPAQEIEREAVDVNRELERLREFYDATANEVAVRLIVDCPQAISARLNRMLLQRAIGNLVSNALRHTPPQGSVTISVGWQDKALHVAVADNGAGIAAVHVPRVFERFYRVHGALNAGATPNVGLGLAIVKSIVEQHGGSVGLASVEGKGTTVTLIFPQAKVD